jgi:hypothetical protein
LLHVSQLKWPAGVDAMTKPFRAAFQSGGFGDMLQEDGQNRSGVVRCEQISAAISLRDILCNVESGCDYLESPWLVFQ